MRNTLICTVGTNLFGNLRRAEGEIKEAFETENRQKLSRLLLEQNNSDRLCGAEINSITSICNKNLLDARMRLIFLVSDTEDGRKIGEILKLYYENSKNPLHFDILVEYRVLAGLRDDDVKVFRQQGLKNLVREISTEVRNFSPETIAINATGGYKAQISFAGAIGQALGIPVYYLFEKFSEVIELPPQPIALDLAFWLTNYPLFERLDAEEIVYKIEIEKMLTGEYIEALIDEVGKGKDTLVELSAMGLLFNERSQLQFKKQEKILLSLIPIDDTEPKKKSINIRDDYGKDVLQEFAKKIRRSPYVKKIINSLPWNPNQTHPIRKTKPDGTVEFVLTWTEKRLGLCLQTTGRNLAETNTISLHLAREFTK